jgi:hypothetical protein
MAVLTATRKVQPLSEQAQVPPFPYTHGASSTHSSDKGCVDIVYYTDVSKNIKEYIIYEYYPASDSIHLCLEESAPVSTIAPAPSRTARPSPCLISRHWGIPARTRGLDELITVLTRVLSAINGEMHRVSEGKIGGYVRRGIRLLTCCCIVTGRGLGRLLKLIIRC